MGMLTAFPWVLQLFCVGSRQNSYSLEFHVVISGSSGVFLAGRGGTLPSDAIAVRSPLHQPLLEGGVAPGGAVHLQMAWGQKVSEGPCVPTQPGAGRVCVESGLVFKPQTISVPFTESRIRRNASVAGRAGGGLDSGFIWENLLYCISRHLRVG